MGRFTKGEVVVFPFPFSNLAASKPRPCLVVSNLAGDDMILCMITKNPYADPDAVVLEAKDFEAGNLPISPSYIRPSRLFTGEDKLVMLSSGRVNAPKLTEVVEKAVEIIQR